MNTRFACLVAAAGCLLSLPLNAASVDETKTRELVAVLQSESTLPEKAQACQRLGEYGSEEAVPALAALLDHELLSAYARAGLERIAHPTASEALRAAIRTTQGSQLVGVINSLGVLRDTEAVEVLTSLTTRSEPGVVKAALLALGRISNDQTIRLVQRALSSGTSEFRPTAAVACLIAAEQQLEQGRSEVAVALYDAVRHAEVPAPVKLGATRGAIVARQPNHIPLLVEQLKSDDFALRNVVLLTIREIPSDALAAALSREVAQASPDLQAQLITAMQDCHNSESLNVIRSQCATRHPEVRMAAITVLSAIGGPDDAPALLEVLENPQSPQETAVVMASLRRMPGRRVDQLIVEAIPTVSTVDSRVNLIRLVEQRLISSALDELLRQAADPEPKVSIASFRAMRSMVGPDNVRQLIALTRTLQGNSARNAAEQTLYRACINAGNYEPAADAILGELEHATDPRNTMSWTRVLTSLGYAKALPVIADGLRAANRDVVINAIAQLGSWPDPAPIEALFGVVENTPRQAERKRALMAVIQLATAAAEEGQRSAGVLVVWFQRANQAVESVQEKRLLISGLARVPHVESVRLLDPYLEDPDVHTEAVVALIEVARPLAKGDDYAVARSALEKLSGVQDESLRQRIVEVQRDIQAGENARKPSMKRSD